MRRNLMYAWVLFNYCEVLSTPLLVRLTSLLVRIVCVLSNYCEILSTFLRVRVTSLFVGTVCVLVNYCEACSYLCLLG
jgi:hypothetical protein